MMSVAPIGRIAAAAMLVFTLAAPPALATAIPAFRHSVAESAAADPALAAFYRGRDYEPLWTGESAAPRREALLTALSQADAHGLPSRRYGAEDIAAAFRAARGEAEIGRLEVRVTRAFLDYARDIQSGALEPGALMPAEIKRELPRRDPAATLAGFAAAENPAAFLRALVPASPQYARLMREKARLERLVRAGGWGPEVPAPALEPGAAGAEVVALRDRLRAMGYLGRGASASYDAALAGAVRAFQEDHGLAPDGIAGRGTMAEINRPAEDRLKAVIVALERERWMNTEAGLGARYIWVNLPDFRAYIVDDGKVVFQTRTVVGARRPDKRSLEFSDDMEYMEINPDWTVPRSIFARDYLPRMQADRNAASYLQMIDSRGRVVPRDRIDFTKYTARNFPYTIRQAPGDLNALGLVKFMFPNPYAIYLHDTPRKELFEREERDYSAGCIRLADPFEFAYRLLERQMSDPAPYFDDLLRSGRQTRVKIETSVPVHLVYFTAFADAEGRIQYRRDIYDRDARLFEALSAAGVAFPELQG